MAEEKPKNRISCLSLILIVSIFGIVLALASTTLNREETTNREPVRETKEVRRQTKAVVNFTGTTFVITNTNDFDWQRAEIIINEKYRYKAGLMESGSTYEVGAGQFTDSENYRFNPFEMKPTEIRIYVKEPISDDWYGELK